MKTTSLILPSCWATYLVYGVRGCSTQAREECDVFISARNMGTPLSVSEDSWFAGNNDANTGAGNVSEYHFLAP